MKTLLMITALTLVTTSFAEASWYQDFCSDAEATTRTANGHNENFVEVTERKWNNDGPQENRIRFEKGEVMVNELDVQQISKEEKKACGEGQEYGWYAASTVTVKKVSLTKEDGSLFSEDTIGVSEDRKSVSAVFVCKSDVTSEMPCKK